MPLLDYIDHAIDVSHFPKLHFVHNLKRCDFEDAKGILRQPDKECNNFPEVNPIYLFYGKPLFNPYDGEDCDPDTRNWPICLIIPPDSTVQIVQMYPFDTGAYLGEPKPLAKDDMTRFFLDEYNRCIPVSEYELGTNIDTICRYIITIFGDNDSYYGDIKDNWKPKCKDENDILDSFMGEIVASRLYGFIGGTLRVLDNRCKTAEIHAVGMYDMKDYVVAAVLPNSLFCEIDRFQCVQEAIPFPYDDTKVRLSEEVVNEICEKTRIFFEGLGCLAGKK